MAEEVSCLCIVPGHPHHLSPTSPCQDKVDVNKLGGVELLAAQNRQIDRETDMMNPENMKSVDNMLQGFQQAEDPDVTTPPFPANSLLPTAIIISSGRTQRTYIILTCTSAVCHILQLFSPLRTHPLR